MLIQSLSTHLSLLLKEDHKTGEILGVVQMPVTSAELSS